MSPRETRIDERDINFKADSRDMKQETKFELEVKPEDFENIEKQMEREDKRGNNRLGFEMEHLVKLYESLSEEEKKNIDAPKFPYEYASLADERANENIYEAAKDKNYTDKQGNQRFKDWSDEEIPEKIAWGLTYSRSYRKDYIEYVDPNSEGYDENIKKEKELTSEELNGIKHNLLKKQIEKGNWSEVVLRAGLLCKLVGAEKFEEMFEFSDDNKKAIIETTNDLKEKDPGVFGTNIRYISELPELLQEELLAGIEITKEDWKNMKLSLSETEIRENEGKDIELKGEKGDYWVFALELCNLRIIKNLIEAGKIKVLKEEA